MKEITVQDLKAMQDAGEKFQLIDVREQHEYDAAQMGGTLIPLGDVPTRLDEINKEGKVIIHCRSGARSGQAIQYLEGQGYDNLANLKGGILAWIAQIDPNLPGA